MYFYMHFRVKKRCKYLFPWEQHRILFKQFLDFIPILVQAWFTQWNKRSFQINDADSRIRTSTVSPFWQKRALSSTFISKPTAQRSSLHAAQRGAVSDSPVNSGLKKENSEGTDCGTANENSQTSSTSFHLAKWCDSSWDEIIWFFSTEAPSYLFN